MKNFFKRLKASQYFLIAQIIIMVLALILEFVGLPLSDVIGLGLNILTAGGALISFARENKQNVKYHDVTGQFIFNSLDDSFSEFMDFMMSDAYKKTSVNEQKLFNDRLTTIAKDGNYDTRRKISRALPYLYDLDKKMTVDVIEILRTNVDNNCTDVRRRTIEGILTIIQKAPNSKKQWLRYKKFEKFLNYYEKDDAYTIVACIEGYFYMYDASRQNSIKQFEIKRDFNNLFEDIEKYRPKVGYFLSNEEKEIIDEYNKDVNLLVAGKENIWKALDCLATLKNRSNEECLACEKFINDCLNKKLSDEPEYKYVKLVIIKNLFIACSGYPSCLCSNKCNNCNSNFILKKINDFLKSPLDDNIYLIMPTVRYFDCVCNNVAKPESKELAQSIMRGYFNHENFLINRTAFDKFSRLIDSDKEFASAVILELLSNMDKLAEEETRNIQSGIENLPDNKKTYYRVKNSRIKFKISTPENVSAFKRSDDQEIKTIDKEIKKHHDRLRFIGRIKEVKENKNLWK